MISEEYSFEQLFRKFRPGLISFAASIIYNRSDAEEIVHDVFLAIWNNPNLKLESAGIKSYLFTAVKNRCLNHIKKVKLDIADLGENAVIPDLSVTAQAQLEAKETAAKLNFLIDQLPNKCKQIFLMSRVHELSYKEIAEVMEITPKTVENQISIALKFLKENFSKNA